MKLSMMFKMFNKLLPGLVLLLAAAAFAANKASCNVAEAVTVNGHRLAPGEYQFQWDGTGPNIDLSILSKGKLIATVPARLVEQSQAGDKNTMRMRENDDGSRSLTQIYFAGKKYAFAIGGDSAAATPQMQSSGNSATSKR